MYFVLGLFVGGIVSTILMAALSSGAVEDMDYSDGYAQGLAAGRAEETAKRRAAGLKASKTRQARKAK